jgi:glycosyltransferase involved in cell wall biosynthesis
VPERRLRSLPRARPGSRIFYFHTWYRGHNNPRYDELLQRLDRVDSHLLRFPRPRLARAATERVWRASRKSVEPAVLRAAARQYRHAFVTDLRQLAHLSVPAVADVDDPSFERDAELLRRGNVSAYVVTAERAARRLEALGVEAPWHVIPHGAPLDKLDPALVEEVARTRREPGTVVAGLVSAFLLLPGDRGGDNPAYAIGHLLDVWDEIVARVPEARLWLIGQASRRVRDRLRDRSDVIVFGPLPRARSFAHVANFDVALYPRRPEIGVRAVKVAEYLGAGVPIVAYDYPTVEDVREAGAGLLVDSPREFAGAVERLVRDVDQRRRLADASRRAGAERSWSVLAERYAAVLDEHLPR